MYIIKNAFKCIGRSKGRNILIGIIALVIAVSACIGLSIRQAAESAKKDTLEGMSVTATISFDRQSMMQEMRQPPDGNAENGQENDTQDRAFDRDQFREMMNGGTALTLDEYKTYASAESVQDFYYTLTAYFDGSDNLEPVSSESESEDESEPSSGAPNGGMNFGHDKGNRMGNMATGDFTVIGYSGDNAMTAFQSGTTSVSDGAVFSEGTKERQCLISEELAAYNDLAVGDTITLTNPDSETETYSLTVSGIYKNTQANDLSVSMFGVGQDPTNSIYMSAAALQGILDASSSVSETVTDETTGRETETAVGSSLSATYVLADADAYNRFEEEVRTLGLDESYTVYSADLAAFENSLTPLNTLSTMAGWFLLVILLIGAVILIVLNIFNIRERKYEIGVLTAMGMKKGKVALQFLTEILVVTMAAILVGAGIGAVSAVPVTNALLANQVESRQSSQVQMENNFGRDGNFKGGTQAARPNGENTVPDDIPGGGHGGFAEIGQNVSNYITEVNSAMNLTVLLQLLVIGLLLTLAAGAVSVLFVMRYDPLKILANRD